MFNALGVGVSFIFGTFLVGDLRFSCIEDEVARAVSCLEDVDTARTDINTLLWVHTAFSALLFALVLLYFPNTPPLPPSNSATEPRTHFLDGFRALVTSRSAWFVMVVYSLSQGLVQMWQSVMVINLTSLGVPGT